MSVREDGLISLRSTGQSEEFFTKKFRLGLFENPYVDPDHAVSVSNTKENKEFGTSGGREGIVLLKNENNLLPLKKDIRSIVVIGPNANV